MVFGFLRIFESYFFLSSKFWCSNILNLLYPLDQILNPWWLLVSSWSKESVKLVVKEGLFEREKKKIFKDLQKIFHDSGRAGVVAGRMSLVAITTNCVIHLWSLSLLTLVRRA